MVLMNAITKKWVSLVVLGFFLCAFVCLVGWLAFTSALVLKSVFILEFFSAWNHH